MKRAYELLLNYRVNFKIVFIKRVLSTAVGQISQSAKHQDLRVCQNPQQRRYYPALVAGKIQFFVCSPKDNY